ncbi:ribonuclease P protein component [Oscillochloris sp. ZM17-4]|uniref:ribonuclease P protein component n=1 Tax=Oscillochloris sp. ZM17-4 TaxID=2866714 RepID=UPI001C72A672|nr:ribonuclease P protein component [Oscillochloris sp. ZM17-4]MBX0328089.1 ribonuclease P protein component [Oscillochloris sp. ZM17-4]
MKRAYRLRRPDQFRRARREGRTFSSPLLLLNVVSGRRRRIRCGFVVGKQIGIAVRRNLAKRRLRESVRIALPHITPGYDLVFVIRSAAIIDTPFIMLQRAVEELLRRAQVWRPSPSLDVATPSSGDSTHPHTGH